MADPSGNNDQQKDHKNDSDATQNPKSHSDINEAESATGTNTSGSNVSKTSDEVITTTHHDGSKEATGSNISSTSNNQDEIIASNTFPDPHASDGITNVHSSSTFDKSQEHAASNAPSDDTQTKAADESDPSNKHNKVDSIDEMNAASAHNEPKETKTSNTSTNSSDAARIDDSAPSHDSNEQERKNDEDSSSHVNKHKQINNPKTSSNTSESYASGTSDISYDRDEPDLLDTVLANATNQNLINRLFGCAYGQALGDAYGLSTEFEDRGRVNYNYPDRSKLIPFPDYVLTSHSRRWKRGDWTDDTDQWILILETLVHQNGDEKVFAEKLTNWIRNGYRELGDHGGMGLGANVSQVVHSHNYINDPLRASEAVWERGHRQAAPNGAVMRCSASAFVHFNDLEKVISTTTLMCKTTHFDPRCIASCLAVCLAITYLFKENIGDNDIEELIKRVQNETIEILGDSFSAEHRDQFLWHTDKARTLEELDLDEPQAIGYTYKCLASGFYGLRSTRPFKETLNDLIRYGGDADTNGAVCGTMYGARHGYAALPYEWLRQMPNKKWLDKKLIQCLEKVNLNEVEPMQTN